MLKKAIAFILVLTAIVTVLVSCANSDNSDVNSSKSSSTVSENATTTSKEASSSASVSDSTSTEVSESETSKDITMNEFFTQAKYMSLQSTVFLFISAYERADKDAALELVVDSDVLSASFNPTKKSMDDMIVYQIVNVTLGTYEKDGKQVETAGLVVSVAFDNDSGAYEFLVNLDYVEYTVNIGGTEGKAYKWLVKEYNLTT